VYVGYRYYETRYEDVVLGTESAQNYDYPTQVQYPFGYGISYTDFSWSDYAVAESGDKYEVSVTVTNNGSHAGKDIVQVYMQSPYTDYDRQNAIEKASVELVGFAKTGVVQPGQKETVKVQVDKESMKVYDADGYGTYIVDAGDYYFAAGQNSHDALNNILAAKGKTSANGMDYDGNASLAKKYSIASLDSQTYAVSLDTGNPISNQFQDADIKHYDSGYKYLSRSDWTGTWPTVYANGSWTAPNQMITNLEINPVNDPSIPTPVTGVIDENYGRLNVAALMEAEYDSDLWDALIGQMSVEDLDKLVRVGGYATMGIDSIQLPATTDKDGPAGFSNTLVGGKSGMSYPSAIVLASTWNVDLAQEFGKAIGEDSLRLAVTGWYAPATNIHRTPYSGRNFEYYSEDAYLSGMICAKEIIGAQEKGVLVYMKHFAVNDQETNRMGGAMFANEQSIRQIFLKPFEISARVGDAHGMMTSMNRIGARWTGAHYGLMTETVRNEWGFEGVAITDQASFSVFAYEDMRIGLEAGNDLWLNSDAELWKLSAADMTPTVVSNMQKASKNIAFAISRSNAMNGLSSGSKVVSIIPLWQKLLIAADVILGLGIIACVVFVTLSRKRGSNKVK
jgi:beta-glucosidase